MPNYKNASASTLDRASICPASLALPYVSEAVGDAAVKGTLVHMYLEHVVGNLSPENHHELVEVKELALYQLRQTANKPALIKDAIDIARNIDLQDLRELFPPQEIEQFHYEVAFKYNVKTEKIVATTEHGDFSTYTPYDNEFTGVADLILRHSNGFYTVIDYKTGSYTPVKDNVQLKFLALCTYLQYKPEYVTAQIIAIDRDGQVSEESVIYNTAQLEELKKYFTSLYLRVEQARTKVANKEVVSVTIGSHCKYCACKQYCPGYTQLAKSALDIQPYHDLNLDLLSPEQLGQLYERASTALDILEAIVKNIKGIAATTPIPLNNGRQLKMISFNKETIDSEAAVDVLKDILSQDELMAISKLTISKSAIKDVLDGYKVKTVMTLLEKSGCLKKSKVEYIKPL